MAKVLLIEDDSQVASSTRRMLEMHESQVVTASTFDAARVALQDETDGFDVIVCDYEFPRRGGGLPEALGCEFLNEAIAAGVGGRSVIVLWSGLDRTTEAREMMLAPPDFILTKGFRSASELLSIVENADGHVEARDRAEA